MSIELRLVGTTVYSVIVFLAVIWAAVGLSYLRTGQRRLMWGSLCVAMTAFAMMFMGLSVIAAEPRWVDRLLMTIFNRTVGLIAMSGGCIFTWQYLGSKWRHRKSAAAPNEMIQIAK